MSLEKIKNNILTQNNRCTDQPMFIVEKEVVDGGIDTEFADEFYYYDYDEDECFGYEEGSDEYEKFEQMEEDDNLPSNVVRHGMRRRWQFVQAFFTEAGAQDYIDQDGHNLGKSRIYGWGSYRNDEFREIRNAIIQGGVK